QTKTGKLRLDKAKIQADAKLDGKFLVSTSDLELSAEDIALGYKQLHEIERLNRDLKHTVDIRPVYHRREDRIRSHVLLCWLALLMIRIIENGSGETWHNIKKNFRPLLVGFHDTRHGPITQTTRVSSEQKRVLDALKLKPPQRYLELPAPKTAKIA
ncbi:MAG: transposase, partial [Trueperaceae bacterium]